MAALSQRPVGGAAAMPHRLPDMGDTAAVIASAVAGTVSTVLAGGAVAILLRRLAGGFSSAPAAWVTWSITAAGIAIVGMIDVVVRAGAAGRWAGIVARLGLLIAVLAMVPLGPHRGSVLVGLVALGVAAAAAVLPHGGGLLPVQHETLESHRGGRFRDRDPAPAPVPRPHAVDLAPAPAGFRQRLERFQTPEDGDRVIGRLLIDVPAGSRTGHGHIGFCPPFAAIPVVEVISEDDGVEVVVSAAEVVPWGVRVECRLTETTEEPLAIPVHVMACSPLTRTLF